MLTARPATWDSILTLEFAVLATSSALIAASVILRPPVYGAILATSHPVALTALPDTTHLIFRLILAPFAPK